ncbi:hypothetical protein HNO92_000940 [Chromobacterium alkanivorans]|uniref:hypothetical protein n=1 Tax=Chromobacterium TaxID=535 RepID=UPI000A40E97B|nr:MULTISPECIES: hypothetical protein [Chromobacterium]MBN3004981.1 hypothetical protein [Chromobacterium alkanivorans]MCS3803280.1 hypothetical protein [Chromobacterium alkanivorans]MCS3817610.1 hypothetical protein [Chromobacterium alkanivorans]MCS3872646.1 hypothetical protein [Chromobacterium alkanivorans]
MSIRALNYGKHSARSLSGIARNVEAFALDTIEGERVIITLPAIQGEQGSEWEGSLIFRHDYLLELLAYSVEHGIIKPGEVSKALIDGSSRPSPI